MQNAQLNILTSFSSICLYSNLYLAKITLALFFKGISYDKKNILVF